MKEYIFLSKNKIFRPTVYRTYKTALENLSIESDRLMDLNWNKRKKIVEYAYNNIDFYKKHFDDAGFHPSQLKDISDWERIPFLEKALIKENFNSFLIKNAKSKWLRSSTTGGSTGEPLKIYRDKRFPEEILQWRMLKTWNTDLGSDIAMVWRIPKMNQIPMRRFINYLLWWPTKRIKLDASYLNENSIIDFTRDCNKVKPKILYGYTGALEEIALFYRKNAIPHSNPEIVWCTAAPVSEFQRDLFEEVFKVPVIDQYACSEVFYIASSCPASKNLHLNIDYRHIDIIDQNNNLSPQGMLGEIALTDLENYAFPLIKYKTGDISSLISAKCSCGLKLPRITPVQGRVSDKITIPDGSSISGEYLTTIFDDYHDHIEKFQIHQGKDYNIVIRVIPKPHSKELQGILSKIKNNLLQKTNNLIRIEIIEVEQISNNRGKTRFIINDLLAK